MIVVEKIQVETSAKVEYIRNSYREGDKVKHQTIARINGISLEQLENMKTAFNGQLLNQSDIKISGGREYGDSSMFFELAKSLMLDKIVYSKRAC